MEKIVLFCKSYRRDVIRAKTLFDSILKYNMDNLKFYLSIPKLDHDIFVNELGTENYNIIYDEDIVPEPKVHDGSISNINENWGWVQQQIVKSEFWKTDICENYFVLDSDTYFIKNFYESDFMYDKNTPYTVMHECKDLLQFTARNGMDFVQKSFIEDRLFVQEIFNRKGRPYDFGPIPLVWSSKVWKSLKDNYLDPNDLTFLNLMEAKHCEFHWYGEWLLKKRPIDIVPVEQYFKNFHYKEQYEEHIRLGDTESTLSENFLGISLETNWGAPIKYE